MTQLPTVRFTNVYGPAEAPSCTCYDLPPFPEPFPEPVPIGTVSVNSRDLIVDDNDGECATGEAGELCIRSSTLTRGYWKRPDLNQRAYLFRDSDGPFPDVYFRTGDLVERHDDGLLRFLGRKDRMIKTRGNRVELDEVEAALASHADVAEAAAVAVPDDQGSTLIVAGVRLGEAAAAETDGLMKHARTKLPAYALPREILVVAEFPRTSSGKIDRKEFTQLYLRRKDS
jgi:acyl-coenzyme A synthetase/AMP-(fatty) acid ligase